MRNTYQVRVQFECTGQATICTYKIIDIYIGRQVIRYDFLMYIYIYVCIIFPFCEWVSEWYVILSHIFINEKKT